MDLAARYQGACDAALFAAECSEDAYRLGELDTVLKPWVRHEIARREDNLSWCDNSSDLALAVGGVADIAPAYARLRRELFSDLHHIGRPEPPWRKVGPTLAVRAPLQVWRRRPQYALRVPEGGIAVAGARTWEFTVFARVAAEPGAGTGVTRTAVAHRVMAFGADSRTGSRDDSRKENIRETTVQVTHELEQQREHYEELTYGFGVLGIRARFAALYDPDAGQGPAASPPG
ncbi:hypothetical protein [Yinghuangia soli]|uniref:Uncharacterized protein n=1 Tax=Yinghuangia soli TaxID=2908204 RepID=A0AA41Q9F8_9ACTN|nr:hypothetical protein [Yinghuangia soli]MCF2533681.1 hypothetical protein [Yinghuangia soli]